MPRLSTVSSASPYPTGGRRSRPRGDSYRNPPNMSRLQLSEEHRRPRRRMSAVSPSSKGTMPRRKSVRFDDGGRPSTRQHSSSSVQQQRPKTFTKDAPPAAISESARDTARRLYHRKPSDGGRPAARPTVERSASTRSLNTTRAEAGTNVGGRHSSRRYDHHHDDNRRDPYELRSSRRR
ncbi:hypothetical protein DOTSEDRAFT_30374 [Dothistroma septosporum NZE10]|uniref:Uncharacterized protein n=1 Tax=Dothistroma septosporum (strain NZE10 / CBS 128990) TaxID=675120 RepID=N1Q1B3_DOTSN|nr:hypothetical protein DOTSEDRAFT_30374 [Dothistroma septosporum NZE10]